MIRTQNTRRGGFTLVELLVGISIFLALAGLTLMIYPGARDQDRVRYAVSDIDAHLRMAQSMAARDKAPRGVRFVVSTGDPNPDKTDSRWVTELQYIEQPPPLLPKRNPLADPNAGTTYTNTGYDPNGDPRVRFSYTLSAGNITSRTCTIENLSALSADQLNAIQGGCTLVMPVLGFWSKISARGTISGNNLPVTLEVYPDALMGGSTEILTYQFAIYLRATPLVGEPTILLPKNICVDLNVSVPGSSGTSDFDVLFGQDGKLVNSPGGQIFLWVRDYTKTAPYTGPGVFRDNASTPSLLQALRQGGEQHVIMIRSSGAHGSNQVAWPDPATGKYANFSEPFRLVRDDLR